MIRGPMTTDRELAAWQVAGMVVGLLLTAVIVLAVVWAWNHAGDV